MSYELQLKKGGILVTQVWMIEKMDWVEEVIDTEDIFMYLKSPICLSSDFILKDFFLFISREIDLFAIMSGCPFLIDIVEEALKPVSFPIKDIYMLELSKTLVLSDDNLINCFNLNGLGKDEFYSLECFSINNMSPILLTLNENIEILDDVKEEVYIQAKMKFTLLDVINGIIEELSAFGPPEFRDMMVNGKAESVGLLSTEQIEEMQLKDIPGVIACKICKKDARAQQFDKPIDMCVDCFDKLKYN
jgi:hypothetical protein